MQTNEEEWQRSALSFFFIVPLMLEPPVTVIVLLMLFASRKEARVCFALCECVSWTSCCCCSRNYRRFSAFLRVCGCVRVSYCCSFRLTHLWLFVWLKSSISHNAFTIRLCQNEKVYSDQRWVVIFFWSGFDHPNFFSLSLVVIIVINWMVLNCCEWIIPTKSIKICPVSETYRGIQNGNTVPF